MPKKDEEEKPRKMLELPYKIMGDFPHLVTDIDRLYKLVQENKSVRLKDAAQALGVDIQKIEEWGNILEDHDLLEMHYPVVGDPVISVYGLQKRLSDERKRQKEARKLEGGRRKELKKRMKLMKKEEKARKKPAGSPRLKAGTDDGKELIKLDNAAEKPRKQNGGFLSFLKLGTHKGKEKTAIEKPIPLTPKKRAVNQITMLPQAPEDKPKANQPKPAAKPKGSKKPGKARKSEYKKKNHPPERHKITSKKVRLKKIKYKQPLAPIIIE